MQKLAVTCSNSAKRPKTTASFIKGSVLMLHKEVIGIYFESNKK